MFLTCKLDWVRSVSLSYDGNYIVSGSEDKSIKLFDLKNKKTLHHFKDAHPGKMEEMININFCRLGKVCEYLI